MTSELRKLLQMLFMVAIASPAWMSILLVTGVEAAASNKPSEPSLQCYKTGRTLSPEDLDQAVDRACEFFSGYIWGNGGWATQVTAPWWDCSYCGQYPIILKVDYTGGNDCAPPMALSKETCKLMMSPIVKTW
jgi:hypothetical protein